MNTEKIALYNTAYNTLTMSPAETIKEMFNYTDENGVLYILELTDDTVFDEDRRVCRCVMNWNSADAEKLIAEHQALYDSLAKIAEVTEVSGDIFSLKFTVDTEALSKDLQAVVDTYLCGTETGDAVYRARKLLKLMAINAPKAVINIESCFLAQAMAVHEYGQSMEVLDTIHTFNEESPV